VIKAAILGLGISFSVMAIASQPAWAGATSERVLLAQQVVEGLPPPPTFSFGTSSLPTVASPAAPVSLPSSMQSNSQTGEVAAQRYLVLVNGDSPLLLEQVRKVESGAFFQTVDGQRVIQAGAFSESTRAEQQVQALEAQGIGAQLVTSPNVASSIVTSPIASSATTASPIALMETPSASTVLPPSEVNQVPTAPVQALSTRPVTGPDATLPPPDLLPASPTASREVVFGQLPNLNSTATSPTTSTLLAAASVGASSYYVVVPGRSGDIPAISDQIIRLGEGLNVTQSLEERRSPLGPHVLVGPFVNRSAAERWSDYFRVFGMDARVYYRR